VTGAEQSPGTALFRASEPFAFFDYLRIPYLVDPALRDEVPGSKLAAATRADASDGPRLFWRASRSLDEAFPPIPFRWGEMRLFGSLLREPPAALGLRNGAEWRQVEALSTPAGEQVAAVWRSDAGSVLLPFDPGEVMRSFWTEAYRVHGAGGGRSARRIAIRIYYLLRPLIPRPLQIRMRRRYARAQTAPAFPRWPIEPSLHDLYRRLHELVSDVVGETVPWIGFWPDDRSWAAVLTHDVETADGRDAVEEIVTMELAAGLRSSWNVVPRRYEVADGLVASLADRGFEVGLHGLYHDGRDLASRRQLLERLPEMRSVAQRIGATGFRSPATQRSPELIALLGFDYDSSYPDTDPYEPQPGGAATWLPYSIGDTVELPITLPQDHTLFVILQHADERVWLYKLEALRRRGGLAVVLTHPDYMLDPAIRAAYGRLLERLRGDASAWHALPRDVAAWWRARAASTLVRDEDAWTIVGPAAGRGRVRLVSPD
jgi:peptidoglycan/xylan/chitin deacetylase (PgdA/CDA1 family)